MAERSSMDRTWLSSNPGPPDSPHNRCPNRVRAVIIRVLQSLASLNVGELSCIDWHKGCWKIKGN